MMRLPMMRFPIPFRAAPLVTLFALAALGEAVRANQPEKPTPVRVETTVVAMGGPFTFVLYGTDAMKLQAAADAGAEEVKRIDALISNYQAGSDWSLINRQAAQGPVRVSQEAFDLIAACVRYSEASQGTFDITVGPLMKLWGFYQGQGRLPHRAEVRVALGHIGYRNLELNTAQRTVRFRRDGMEIDPGGIGKGYAVDRVAAVFREYGVEAALISAARSSLYALGAPPGEPGWKVDIRHPRDGSQVAQQVLLKNESMATSGNYEKFFRAQGKMYSHIMDPRTGFPAEGMLQVSVIAPRGIDSEAWTKPIYIQGRQWAVRNKPAGLRAYVCEDRAVRGPFLAAGDKNPCVWLP
jgi:thiamine biosynthesis lipoprotein